MPGLHPKVGDQEALWEVPVLPLRFKRRPSKHKATIYSANLFKEEVVLSSALFPGQLSQDGHAAGGKAGGAVA